MKKTLSARLLSIVLCLSILLSCLPLLPTQTAAMETDTRVADPSTMDSWKDIFLPDPINTENAGRVWTDKSVFTDSSAFVGTGITMDSDRSFLVALSAMASNMSVTGISNMPTDTMIILDLSSSMYPGRDPSTINTMLASVNESIEKLLSLNEYNRVGVVVYYGGPDRNQSDASNSMVLLPLDRYSGTTTYLKANVKNGKLQSVAVNKGVINSAGETVPQHTRVVTDIAGTYTQLGILDAMNVFLSAEIDRVRTPVFIFMSDGEPTAATHNYTQKVNAGMGNNTVSIRSPNETDFVTQLTAAYAKERVDQYYGSETGALFYSLSLGNSVSLAVMDPGQHTTTTIDGYWTKLLNNGSVDITVYNSPNAWGAATVKKTYTVKTTTVNGETFPASKDQRNYVDKAFTADSASDLTDVFGNIISEIGLVSKYLPTLSVGNADLSGYVSFVDKVGIHMEVTDIKGILMDDVLFSGAELSKNFVTGGGNLGTYDDPKPLGDELVWSVQERLGLDSVEQARTLIGLAFRNGQLSYTSETDYSNYIGWYANAAGEFLAFWHESVTTAPEITGNTATDPVYIIRSYIYLGEVNEKYGLEATDLMYATVQIRENIATGEQSVAFAIPAALIPLVSYDVKLDIDHNITELNVSGAEHPIRLVYEVALDERINEYTVKDIVSDEYLEANTDSTGAVRFYSNQYEADNSVGYGKVNTYSYFNPSRQNGQYYYLTDSPVYADQNGTLYTGSSKPTGTCYRAYTVYGKDGNTLSQRIVYREISAAVLTEAKQAEDGTWYIGKGNVITNLDGYTFDKSANPTDTLTYANIPFVDTHNHSVGELGYNFIVGATLGNNGMLDLVPATGIVIRKAMAEGAAAPATPFRFTITNLTDGTDSGTYPARVTNADGTTTDTIVTFTAGTAEISLYPGQSIAIGGMTAGTDYRVEEVETLHYIPEKAVQEVTVQNQTLAKLTFVNDERGTGGLTISKHIKHTLGSDHAIPKDLTFVMDVSLSGIGTANATFDAVHTDGSITSVTTDAQGCFTVILKNQEQLQISGLPAGTVATVVERDPADGFSPVYVDNGETGDGIVMIVKDQSATVVVVNEYIPDPIYPINVEVKGIKTMTTSADDWNGAQFQFQLQKWTDDSWVTIATATATEDAPAFSFTEAMKAEKFTATGTYTYQIIETHAGEVKDGITYDATVHTFGIVVTDADMDGHLEIGNVTSFHSDQDFEITDDGSWHIEVTFHNRYDATGCDVVLDVQKQLANPSGSTVATLAGFRFGLYDSENNLFAHSELTDGVGEARFILHYKLEDAGTHTYTLKEIVPASVMPGMNYSTQSYTVVVDVTDNGNGTTSAKIVSIDGAEDYNTPTFTNTYDPTDATIKLDFSKKILNGRAMKAGEFTFELRGVNNNMVRTGSNDADGNIVFNQDLVFDTVGMFNFTLTETTTDGNGITADPTVYRIVVNVTDVNGELTASYQVIDAVDDTVTFVNTYQPKDASYIVSGTKVLVGRNLLNEEFTFLLTQTDANGNALEGGTVLTARNFLDGQFNFPALTFTEEGTYHYVVSEQPATGDPHGITYDTSTFAVTITVTDNLKGQLVASGKISGADRITFQNTYIPKPTDAVLPGSKTLNGKVLNTGDFSFELYASDAEWTLGDLIETVENGDGGSFTFSTLHFDTAKTYYYLVRETNSGETIDGVTYDSRVYRVTIEVTDDLRGHLVSGVTIHDEQGIPHDTIVFINTYVVSGDAQVTLEGTKTLEGAELTDGAFTFQMFAADESFTVSGDPIQTATNADGKFSMTLRYTDADVGNTYYYIVKEENAGQTIDGITYCSAEYRITVEVKDNGKGVIETAATILCGETSVTSLDFVNTYTVDGDAQVKLKGTKTLEGAELTDGAFTFQMFAADESFTVSGDPIQTATNADGKFTMTLDYTEADLGNTYYYVVKEKHSGRAINGMFYSNEVYRIVVQIQDNGNGGIQAVSTIRNSKDEAVTSLDFVNIYEEPDSPNTGDNGILLWMSMLLISAMALCMLIYIRKARRQV